MKCAVLSNAFSPVNRAIEKKSLGDSHIGSASVLKPRTEIAFVESERVDGYLFERSGCANDNWLCKGF